MGSCSVDDQSLPFSLKLSNLLLLLFTLSFLSPSAQGRATSSSQDAHEWATSGLNRKQQRSVSNNDSDSLSESSGYSTGPDEVPRLHDIVPSPDVSLGLYTFTEWTEGSALDRVLLNVQTVDGLHHVVNVTYAQRPKSRSCSRGGTQHVANVSVRSPIDVDNSNFQWTCSTCTDEKSSRTWNLPLLLNCTRELANITALTSGHVLPPDHDRLDYMYDGRWTYVASCVVYTILVGDVIRTTWDCLLVVDRCPSFPEESAVLTYDLCIREKCEYTPFDWPYLLATTSDARTKNRYCAVCNGFDESTLTTQYVDLNCQHYGIAHILDGSVMMAPDKPFFHVVRDETVVRETCPNATVHVSRNDSCRPVFNVLQANTSTCAQGQCNYATSLDIEVQNFSGSGSLLDLENITDTTPDCYVVESDQAIVCNTKFHLSCNQVVALKQTEFSVLEDGHIHDHVTGAYLKIGEYIHINGTVFRCNVFSKNYTTIHKVWNVKMLPIILSAVACALTSLCCLIVFVTYCLFTELRTLPGICTMSYVLSLGVTFLILLVGADRVEIKWLCTLIGFLFHYFALSHFTWSSVIAVNLLRSFVITSITSSHTKTRKSLIFYNIIGWGIPLFVCVTCLVLDKGSNVNIDYATDKLCYLQAEISLLVGFVAPVSIIVLFNLLTFIVLVVSIHTTMKTTKMATLNSRVSNTKRKLRTFTGIFSLLGLTWILALMASIKSLKVLWYLFFVITLLHGPTLLIIFVFNNRTRQLYIQNFGKILNFSKTTNSTKNKDIKSLTVRKITQV